VAACLARRWPPFVFDSRSLMRGQPFENPGSRLPGGAGPSVRPRSGHVGRRALLPWDHTGPTCQDDLKVAIDDIVPTPDGQAERGQLRVGDLVRRTLRARRRHELSMIGT
jgi:hypothetical protein